METLTLGAAIIAVLEWIKSLDTKNLISNYITLPVAIILGAVAGYAHFLGTQSIEQGVVAGFLAVGIHTTARAAGRAQRDSR